MSNKKVGILTFSYSSNPGSVLQAYALQETISGFDGFEARIINYQKTRAYRPVWGQNVFTRPIRKWTPKKIVGWTLRYIAYPLRMRKYNKFFKKYYITDPQKPISREALADFSLGYDAFVVGSDQVWNFDSVNVDYTYFLDFPQKHCKKISYAASFGQAGVPERERVRASELIGDFSSISVREEDGVEAVKQLAGRSAEWVLDPSLIFPEERLQKMAERINEDNYVFLYLRENSAALENFANRLAKQYGLKVVKALTHWKCNKKGKKSKPMGPCEWLGYMKNARFVVTNSFHGICFSIVYKKEFYVDLLKGGRAFTNPRIAGVLGRFGLESRCIDSVQSIDALENIDYAPVNLKKRELTETSLRFLKNAIEGDCND